MNENNARRFTKEEQIDLLKNELAEAYEQNNKLNVDLTKEQDKLARVLELCEDEVGRIGGVANGADEYNWRDCLQAITNTAMNLVDNAIAQAESEMEQNKE